MCLNRARRAEVMELETDLSAADTDQPELEAALSQEAMEKSATDIQRVDPEMDRSEAEEPARDLVRAT